MDEVAPTLLARLLDQSIDGALIIDENAIIRYANPAMAALSGWPRGVLEGSSLNLLLPEHLISSHDGWVRSYCQRQDGHSSVLGHVREMTLHRQSGEEIPIELKAVDLGDLGNHRYLGGFMQDVRARKALESDRQRLSDLFHRLAMTDPLTNLPNRRAFDIEVTRLIAQMRRTGLPAAVAILDIDHFKRVNDGYGHGVGDAVLRTIASVVETQLRAGDFVARVGGEEFALLMPSTNSAQAVPVMERLRETIARSPTDVAGHPPVMVTVSIGIAVIQSEMPFDLSWNRADEALYDAKESGRNRTIFK